MPSVLSRYWFGADKSPLYCLNTALAVFSVLLDDL